MQARHALTFVLHAAGPTEKDRLLLVDFQVVIAEFKLLDDG